jgi:hypothetical protein
MEPVHLASSAAEPRTPGEERTGAADRAGRADCVLCGEPTEHPATKAGATLCPVCEWQEAERTACSG